MRSIFRAEGRVPPARGRRRRLLGGGLALAAAIGCVRGDGSAVRVVVPSGAVFAEAADSLASADLVASSRLFRLYAKLRGRDRALRAGTYELHRGDGWSTMLDALTEGGALVVSITIPEGFAVSSIAPLLATRLSVPPESVAAAIGDSALRARLAVTTPTTEGYLFPETYRFAPGTTARTAVETMIGEFERRWRPAWTARLDTLGMSRNEIVTLASIIEKEARVPEERPLIAAVYCNRLQADMPLQADPTVQYAMGRHVERVLYRDLDVESPYNTYRHPGLPPGPIASPGTASIEAALYPADVPYLFFVARPDGHHEFRRTFAEHSRAREEVRRLGERIARERARSAGISSTRAGDSSAARVHDSAAAPVDSTVGAVAPRDSGRSAPAIARAAGDSLATVNTRARCR